MHQINREHSPEQAGIHFWGVESVYGSQNAPMLWQCIITGIKEHFEGHRPYQPPQEKICLLGELSLINLMQRPTRLGLVWASRAPYSPVAIMVRLVVVLVGLVLAGTLAYCILFKLSCK
jgi:hypothetical protein